MPSTHAPNLTTPTPTPLHKGEGKFVGAPMPPANTPHTNPIVALRGVGKTFPSGTVALAGLDLDVRNGEFLSLLGPSGCGKSTALRIIAGLSEPTQGTVEWDATPAESDSRIGFVFQEPTLMPWATVFNNVMLPLKLKRTTP